MESVRTEDDPAWAQGLLQLASDGAKFNQRNKVDIAEQPSTYGPQVRKNSGNILKSKRRILVNEKMTVTVRHVQNFPIILKANGARQ